MYGIAVEKPVKPVVKVEESVVAETVKKSEPVKIPPPTVEDGWEFSLDDILNISDQEQSRKILKHCLDLRQLLSLIFVNDDQLFPKSKLW